MAQQDRGRPTGMDAEPSAGHACPRGRFQAAAQDAGKADFFGIQIRLVASL